MSYINNIPAANDFILVSQPQLLNNFDEINDAYNVNHVPMQDQNAGKHSMFNLKTSADPTTGSDEVGLYSKVGTGGIPQTFFRPASNGTPIQLSYNGTQTLNGSVNVTNFSGAVAGPPSFINVTAAGNTFVVGDIVNFADLVGVGAPNVNKQGTVTVAGSTFTITSPSRDNFTNGAITSGTVFRTTTQCQTFFAGPFIVLFGRADGIVNADTFVYSDYSPGVTFSSVRSVLLTATSNNFTPLAYNKSTIQIYPTLITTSQFTFLVNFTNPPSSVPPVDVFYTIIGQP